jgi:hypothetical protein
MITIKNKLYEKPTLLSRRIRVLARAVTILLLWAVGLMGINRKVYALEAEFAGKLGEGALSAAPVNLSLWNVLPPISRTPVIPVALLFDQPVLDFAISDIVVTNATVTTLIDNGGDFYWIGLSPHANGPVTFSLPAGAVTTLAGASNVSSPVWTTLFELDTKLINWPPVGNPPGPGLQVVDVSDPQEMANLLVGPGITLVPGSAVFTGDLVSAGVFSDGNAVGGAGLGINSGLILTSGRAKDAIGPNDSTMTSNGAISARLKFSFITSGGDVSFRYVFASEEYPEFMITIYNDLFEFLLDGVNIALVPNTNVPVRVNTINSVSPEVWMPMIRPGSIPWLSHPVYSEYFIPNYDQPTPAKPNAGTFNIEYDGFTVVLTATATNVAPGVHTLDLFITDMADASWDSAVFIEAGSLTTRNAPVSATFTAQVTELTNLSLIPLTLTFDRPVSGLEVADLVATNATVTGLTGSGATYGITLAPFADGPVTLTLPAGVASDALKPTSLNLASAPWSTMVDRVAPVITGTALNPAAFATPGTPVQVRLTSTEPLVGFDLADLGVTGATLDGFVVESPTSALVTLTPVAGSLQSTLNVVAGGATDATGNIATGAPFTLDWTPPPVAVALASPVGALTNLSALPTTITFARPVTGLTASDLVVTNATITAFGGSGATYTVTLAPLADGPVSLTVPANVANDAVVATVSNMASPLWSTVVDNTPPVVSFSLMDPGELDGPTSEVRVRLTANEPLIGLGLEDLNVAGATPGTFVLQSPTSALVRFTPSPDSLVAAVALASGGATDAAGNPASASPLTINWPARFTPTGQVVTAVAYLPPPCMPNRMLNGRFQGSNDKVEWTTLATITTLPASGVYGTLPVTDSRAWRYVRYLGSDGSYGEASEIHFYNGSTELFGTPFGSPGTTRVGYAKALDWKKDTTFSGPSANGVYFGQDLTLPSPNLIVADSFAYVEPTLAGRNGGYGWNAPWIGKGNPLDGFGYVYAHSPLNLLVNGGRVATGHLQDSYRALPATYASGTYWLSYLARASTTGNRLWGGVSLFDGWNERLFTGVRWGQSLWGLERAGFGSGTSWPGVNPTAAAPALILIKIELRPGASKASLWVNPPLIAPPSMAGAATVDVADFQFNQVRIMHGFGPCQTFGVDELRLGHTWESVVPLP